MSESELAALERDMSAAHLRGQWMADSNRPQRIIRRGSTMLIEPVPAGATHAWRWADLSHMLDRACKAMPESYTARRALVLANPLLTRGTTHTMIASIQAVRPGEVAWAHRHVINALRFSIQGSRGVFTVVNGRELVMEPYDLILTPSWTWHDHHNESAENAIWMDALDVPFTLALNQQFYEESGDVAQPRISGDFEWPSKRGIADTEDPEARPYRYPWREMKERLKGEAEVDPSLGICVRYTNPRTGGSVLPTIDCRIQVLPPGFIGKPMRSTASEIAFVVEGEGSVILEDQEVTWETHDSLALGNWTQRRFVNRSKTDRAVLFVMSDAPILSAFGYLRTERSEDMRSACSESAAKATAAG